mmetsp:Transcript_13087/g.38480  ORF Transcript_13087/g.38480 Transcript_13087/m.38480 type:complete len:332 (-) Transcript_13087:39-1034(-)
MGRKGVEAAARNDPGRRWRSANAPPSRRVFVLLGHLRVGQGRRSFVGGGGAVPPLAHEGARGQRRRRRRRRRRSGRTAVARRGRVQRRTLGVVRIVVRRAGGADVRISPGRDGGGTGRARTRPTKTTTTTTGGRRTRGAGRDFVPHRHFGVAPGVLPPIVDATEGGRRGRRVQKGSVQGRGGAGSDDRIGIDAERRGVRVDRGRVVQVGLYRRASPDVGPAGQDGTVRRPAQRGGVHSGTVVVGPKCHDRVGNGGGGAIDSHGDGERSGLESGGTTERGIVRLRHGRVGSDRFDRRGVQGRGVVGEDGAEGRKGQCRVLPAGHRRVALLGG